MWSKTFKVAVLQVIIQYFPLKIDKQYNKIKTIRANSDILNLASDGNYWGVKIKDKEIWEHFKEEYDFQIEREWDSSEICDLISLLEIDNTDL